MNDSTVPISPIFCHNNYDRNQYVICNETGEIKQEKRTGNRVLPYNYTVITDNNKNITDKANSIEFHPNIADYFLVGYSSGSVGIYNIHHTYL